MRRLLIIRSIPAARDTIHVLEDPLRVIRVFSPSTAFGMSEEFDARSLSSSDQFCSAWSRTISPRIPCGIFCTKTFPKSTPHLVTSCIFMRVPTSLGAVHCIPLSNKKVKSFSTRGLGCVIFVMVHLHLKKRSDFNVRGDRGIKGDL